MAANSLENIEAKMFDKRFSLWVWSTLQRLANRSPFMSGLTSFMSGATPYYLVLLAGEW